MLRRDAEDASELLAAGDRLACDRQSGSPQGPADHLTQPSRLTSRRVWLGLGIVLVLCMPFLRMLQAQTASPGGRASDSQAAGVEEPGALFTSTKLQAMLPATVYFRGRTAPLQLRNAGGLSLAGSGIVWSALVDTSGYSSNVQERYQFYLVTEGQLSVGGNRLAAGAYGGGFVGERFVIMDLGGGTVAEGSTTRDTAFARPRPLQLVPAGADGAKLYLGRRWVLLQALHGLGDVKDKR